MVVTGRSFGSLFGTLVAANEPRLRACAVMSTCLEPGCHTIFEEASPTFKKRFMWMSDYTDEGGFRSFCCFANLGGASRTDQSALSLRFRRMRRIKPTRSHRTHVYKNDCSTAVGNLSRITALGRQRRVVQPRSISGYLGCRLDWRSNSSTSRLQMNGGLFSRAETLSRARFEVNHQTTPYFGS